MSQYIPTTAEVRDAYSSESSDSRFANRAFDLWLARYKAKIIAQTEERIIKLLETEMERVRLMTGYPATNALANIRAAVKGEQK